MDAITPVEVRAAHTVDTVAAIAFYQKDAARRTGNDVVVCLSRLVLFTRHAFVESTFMTSSAMLNRAAHRVNSWIQSNEAKMQVGPSLRICSEAKHVGVRRSVGGHCSHLKRVLSTPRMSFSTGVISVYLFPSTASNRGVTEAMCSRKLAGVSSPRS